MSHTKEPWPAPDVQAFNWTKNLCELKAGCLSVEDYTRAVACVNYCAAVPTEQLNCTSLPAVLKGNNSLYHDQLSLRAELAAIKAERDGLREALAEIASHEMNAGCGCSHPCRCDTETSRAIAYDWLRDVASAALEAFK